MRETDLGLLIAPDALVVGTAMGDGLRHLSQKAWTRASAKNPCQTAHFPITCFACQTTSQLYERAARHAGLRRSECYDASPCQGDLGRWGPAELASAAT